MRFLCAPMPPAYIRRRKKYETPHTRFDSSNSHNHPLMYLSGNHQNHNGG